MAIAPGDSRQQRARQDPAGHVVKEETVVRDGDHLPEPAGAILRRGNDPCAGPRARRRTVPGKRARKVSSHATLSQSRWFVGSSSSSMSGASSTRRHSATRRRSPPDSTATLASGGGQRSASIARSTCRSSSHPLAASIAFCSFSMRDIRLSMSAPGAAIAALTSSNSFSIARIGATPGAMFSITVSPSFSGGSCSR